MPRFDIEFAVNGQTQTLTVTQRKAIRAGSKNYWYAVFALDATVAELSPLYATFSREPYHRNRGRAIIVPLEQSDARSDTEYSCQFPWEVLTRKGSVFVGLFAGDMLVTNEVEIEVTEAAPTLGSEGHHTAPWYKPFVDALNGKQDKEAGKGLSSNDYTNEDKEKVAGIPANPHYTDTTYTAGDGINIDEDNVISATGGSYSPYIGINGHWYEWRDSAGDYVDTGVSAQGAKGDKGDTGAAGADGFSPTASVSKAGTTATITITDKNGTTSATINDGAKGDKGDTGAKGDTGDSGSFTCVYGVTTWAEFAAAVQAGKSIKIRDGISYGWADMIDIDNGYASFTIIAGEDYATSWCEFYADGGWMNWTGGALVDANYVQTALAAKQDTISDLETIRSGAAAGATAVQPTALTAYRTASAQDLIDGAQDTAIAAKYAKPSGGIPSSDMASAVQTSLGKANTAYQKPSGGIPAADLASGVIPSVPSAATATPSALGTAAVGSSAKYAREDHVHAMPSASDVGAIAAPSSPTSGQFLVYNGSAWVAQTLSTWQGGNY